MPYLAQLRLTQAYFDSLDAAAGASEDPAEQHKRRAAFYFQNAVVAYRCPEPHPSCAAPAAEGG